MVRKMQFTRRTQPASGIVCMILSHVMLVFSSIGRSSSTSSVDLVSTREYILMVPSALNPAIEVMKVLPPNTRPKGCDSAASPTCDSERPKLSAYRLRGFIPSMLMIFLEYVSASVIVRRVPVGLKIFSLRMSNAHIVFTKRRTAPSETVFPL